MPTQFFSNVTPRIALVVWLGWTAVLNASEEASMARIPSGVYRPLFRAAADSKELPVTAFLLDILPVTNAEFLEFVRANPRWRRSQVKRLFADENYLKAWSSDLEIGSNILTNAPVTYVSWFAAKAYAQWRGKRLPSFAEWEYAAAAGANQPDARQDPQFRKRLTEWLSSPASSVLPAVGLGQTNFYGVHDLHGLVWEWVADFNTVMVTGDSRGDTGLEQQLFCGSGSLGAKDTSDYAAFMRAGFRSSLQANYAVHNLGFRCAKDL